MVSLDQIREALGAGPEVPEAEVINLWNQRVKNPFTDVKIVLRQPTPIPKRRPMTEQLETKA